jgi:hypothetical protein
MGTPSSVPSVGATSRLWILPSLPPRRIPAPDAMKKAVLPGASGRWPCVPRNFGAPFSSSPAISSEN